jgi:hypothetical protein
MIDPCILAGEHVDGCIYQGVHHMTDKPTKAPKKTNTPRQPSAGALLKHLNEYMKREDIGADAPIGTVIGKLEDTIVAEDQAKR